MIGRSIGHHEILEEIGAGGMGVVYRGRDTRLDRHVAVKTLPDDIAADAARLSRFEREAKTIAALSHPNICAIYGLEMEDDRLFLILELIEGPTLGELLAQGPLEPKRALEIAVQLTRALEIAHQRGLVHRDLKPSNVKFDLDGNAKVLDFGLAKELARPYAESTDFSVAGTLSDRSTRAGMVLGTAPYMSPEQARGMPVDQRTDIWAFGCVLFEMLTGRRPFGGSTSTDVTASILRGEPDWGALPSDAPHSLRRLLEWCLAKDKKDRLQSMRDVRLLLEAIAAELGDPPATAGSPGRRLRPGMRYAVATMAGIGLLALGWLAGSSRLGAPEPTGGVPVRLSMSPPPGWAPTIGWGHTVAISADGTHLAYVLEQNRMPELFVKRIDELDVRRLPGTRGARTPFFSPDGRWLGFYDEESRQLKRISLGGGEPQVIVAANDPWGAVWARDGTIIYTSRYSGLMRVPVDGGSPTQLTTAGARQHLWPALLPGGEVVLFTDLPARGSFDDAAIVAVPLAGGEPKVILESAYYPHYSPSGHLVFVQGNSVVAAPFDTATLEVTGPATTVIDRVWISSWIGYADFAFSSTGTLIYVSGGPDRTRARLVWVDRSGSTTPLLDERRPYAALRLHADANRLAVTILDKDADIWGYEFDRGQLTRLTGSPAWDAYPLWRPLTDSLTFSSMRDGLAAIYDGDLLTGEVTRRVRGEHPMYPGSWSADGRRLAYWEEHPETGLDIWVYSPESGETVPFLVTAHNESAPEFSPDGRFIAYESNESGDEVAIYVRPYPELNPATRVSTADGRSPRWRKDAAELFYLQEGNLMAVDVATSGGFEAGTPHRLFAGSFRRHYDLRRDAQEFLMISTTAAGDPPLHINLISGWFDELKRRAPLLR